MTINLYGCWDRGPLNGAAAAYEMTGSRHATRPERVRKFLLYWTDVLVIVGPLSVAPTTVTQAAVRGFLGKDASAEELATAIRKVHGGGRYLDAELAATAMAAGDSPLTERERDALRLATEGASVAQTRLEAIRTAQRMGWL